MPFPLFIQVVAHKWGVRSFTKPCFLPAPGRTQNIVYANYAGQTMLHVFQDGDDEWLEFWKYKTPMEIH